MKIYRGRVDGSWDDAIVEVWERPADGGGDRLIGPLAHVVKHSPSGFSWGYAGSGPAELARCILLDHLGEDSVCSVCRGARRLVLLGDPLDSFPSRPATDDDDETVECASCWGEGTLLAPATYQSFKFEFVARWPTGGSWEVSSVEVEAWLKVGARGL